jgi:hypothetical protein
MDIHTIKPYPRFVPLEVEELFIHWLLFERHHGGKNIIETVSSCYRCFLLKDCIDVGVMKQLNAILEAWEKKLRGSNIASLLLGYMTEEEARLIYQTVKHVNLTGNDKSEDIGKRRILEMFDIYFPSITHRDILEISIESGHYLPFIIYCVVQFKTLVVRYNEFLMNVKENFYYMIAFVLLNFHLNGVLAFSPATVKFMPAEIICESIIAWFYGKFSQNVQ